MLVMLKARLESDVNSAKIVIDDFKKKMDVDPCYALEWGDHVYTHTARMNQAQILLQCIEYSEARGKDAEDILRAIRKFLLNEMRQGQWTESSTSTSSNLIKRERLAAASRLYYDHFSEV